MDLRFDEEYIIGATEEMAPEKGKGRTNSGFLPKSASERSQSIFDMLNAREDDFAEPLKNLPVDQF